MVRQANFAPESHSEDVQASAKPSPITAQEPTTTLEIPSAPNGSTGRVTTPHTSAKNSSGRSHSAWPRLQLYCAYFCMLLLGIMLVGQENWHTAAKTADKWIAEDPDTDIVDVVTETGTVIVRSIVMAYGCYALLRDGWIPT